MNAILQTADFNDIYKSIETITDESDLKALLQSHQDRLILFIKVDGKDYQASFPSSFAEALVTIQRNFYKSVAYALYGKDDIRKLTKQDLKDYELIFTIKSGSTDVIVDKIINAVCELANKVMDGMDVKSKAIFIMAMISLIGFFVVSWKAIGEQGQTARAQIAQQQDAEQERTKQEAEKQQTERLKAALNSPRGTLPTAEQVLDHTEKTSEDSRIAVLHGVKTANTVQLGNQQYSSAEIRDATQRAERGQLKAVIETGTYFIIISNFRDSDILRLTLVDSNGNEISAALDTKEIDADTQELLWQAFRNRSPLSITLNKTYTGQTFKDAYIKDAEPIKR